MDNQNSLHKINLEETEPSVMPSPGISDAPKMPKFFPFLIVILLGIGSGVLAFSLFPLNKSKAAPGTPGAVSVNGIRVGDEVGIDQENADEAVGILETGGFEGEGSHHLVRPGGEDQTVYLTSSVVDLDQFVGHKVTVWGETFSAQKAGWLMDVVKLRVEELNASTP